MTDNVVRLIPRPRTAQDPDGGHAVYTVKEVSQLLTLSLGNTYALIRSGTIPALRMGARWVVPKKRFHAWLDGLPEGDPATAPPSQPLTRREGY